MSIVKNGFKSAVLWHMDGCIVTFFESETQDAKNKRTIETIYFASRADLAYQNMSSLRIASPAVPYLENLASLRLQNNNLKTLPNELWRLTNLQELNLGYNQLEEIPIEVGLLFNLQELYLHNNQLTLMPFQIGNLIHLKVLDVTANRLLSVPSRILDLQLEDFWFDLNKFEDAVPTSMSNLEFLSLENICRQSIGLLCASDEDAREVISASDFFLDKSILLTEQKQLLIPCAICNALVYQAGLELIEATTYNKTRISLAYKVCSQACYIHLFQNRS